MVTYTKLRDGSWGIKVAGTAIAGQVVTVTTKAGDVRTETVARVMWTGPNYCVCTFIPKPRKAAKKKGEPLIVALLAKEGIVP